MTPHHDIVPKGDTPEPNADCAAFLFGGRARIEGAATRRVELPPLRFTLIGEED
ncbi:hypothetical protein [Poseidonocella pacifica]|uniref:hypothetical protein n=1 Tax=Poseidonocella pacifica TaxID=871651 RepID=UPI001587D127|nr:hypothetical protein [Poseidonocella pacifica]